MWYWHNGMGVGAWAFMIVNMVLFWALIVAGIVLLVRLVGRRGRWPAEPPSGGGSEAEQVLANRFAHGEIDEDEYHRRLEALRRGAPAGPR